jgi:hypothetical protein
VDVLKRYLTYIGQRSVLYLIKHKIGLKVKRTDYTYRSCYVQKTFRVKITKATSQSLAWGSLLLKAKLRHVTVNADTYGIRIRLGGCQVVIMPKPKTNTVADNTHEQLPPPEVPVDTPENASLQIIEGWIDQIYNNTKFYIGVGRLTYYITPDHRIPYHLTWKGLQIQYRDNYLAGKVQQCQLWYNQQPVITIDRLGVKQYQDKPGRPCVFVKMERVTATSLTTTVVEPPELPTGGVNPETDDSHSIDLGGRIRFLSIREPQLALGIQGYGIRFQYKSTHWQVKIKYLSFILVGQVSASIQNVCVNLHDDSNYPNLNVGNASLRIDDTLIGFINRLSDLLPNLFELSDPMKHIPVQPPTPSVITVIHNYMDHHIKSDQPSKNSGELHGSIVINDYFGITEDREESNPPSRCINYTSVLRINKIVCLVGNKASPVAYFGLAGVSHQVCPNQGWKLRLENGYIRDLSESYWDYLFYRVNQHLPSLELKFTQQPNTDHGDKYNVQLELADSGWNIDEACLQSMLPFLQDTNIAIQRLLEYFPSDSIHITTCQVTSFHTVISYKPCGINLGRLQRGEADELLRLGTIRDTPLQLKSITLTNMFSLGELFQCVVDQWVSEISQKGPYLVSQLGYLKYVLSPTVHLSTLFKTRGGYLRKIRHYTKGVAHDLLEMVGRTTVKVEETLDYVTNTEEDDADISKYSKSPNGLLEGLTLAQQHLERKPFHQKITSSIRDTVIGLQTSLEKQHYQRVHHRYKH